MAMTLRLDEERAAELRRAASEDGRSMQQTALRAIDEYLARRGRASRVTELARQAAADYPETLRRLGE
jgi:hypothetical protein